MGKYLIAFGVLGLAGFHILMTVIYLSPANLATVSLGRLATTYINPLFRQNWHLFSPNPGIASDDFLVQCGHGEKMETDWLDPLDDLRERHNANRFSGVGKLLYLYDRIDGDLLKSYATEMQSCSDCSDETLTARVARSPAFHPAARFAAAICLGHSTSGSFDSFQIRVRRMMPTKYSDRATGRPFDHVEEITFESTKISSVVAPSPEVSND